jgi:hypothetical protein
MPNSAARERAILVSRMFKFAIVVRTTLFVPTDYYGRFFFPLSYSVSITFASRLLLPTICSYLSLVRIQALVLSLYIIQIFLDCCDVVQSFPLSISA